MKFYNEKMSNSLLIPLAAFFATSAMTLFIYSLNWLGLVKLNVIQAIGSLVSRDKSPSFVGGLILHYVFGLLFASIYILVAYLLFSSMSLSSSVLAICASLGLFHGLIVAFLLTIVVTEHHPLQRIRNRGVGVSFAYLIAHIIFGLVLGLVLAAFNYPEQFVGLGA